MFRMIVSIAKDVTDAAMDLITIANELIIALGKKIISNTLIVHTIYKQIFFFNDPFSLIK